MPFINSIISIDISEEQENLLKNELAKLMTKHFGKSEEWLMLTFDKNKTIYFAGQKKVKSAFIDFKILGTQDEYSKEQFVSDVSELYEKELDISENSIYITITEVKDWAWNGRMF